MKKKLIVTMLTIGGALLLVALYGQNATAQETSNQDNGMKKKILFVVTSHEKLGDTGKKTGYELSEVSHPWKVLTEAGYDIDFVSPLGGKPPVDGFNLEDPINKEFWENKTARNKIDNSMKPTDVDPAKYVAIFFAGGHGTMWDFPDNAKLAEIAKTIYENNGVVAAVCHGPAALVNIKLGDGKYLVNGKKINSFTDDEERAVKMDKVVPFLLETKLVERGAQFEKSGIQQKHVTVDQRVVTGQNPASATGVGEAIAKELQ